MKWTKLMQSESFRKLTMMMFLSIVSGWLSDVRIIFPGFDAIAIDLREIPLLLSIFYFRNPLYLVGLVVTSTAFTPNIEDYELVNFTTHFLGLLAMFYLYKELKKFEVKQEIKAVAWGLAIIFIYYAIVIVTFSLLIVYYKEDSNGKTFFEYLYKVLTHSFLEEIYTSFIVSFFYLMHTYNADLKKRLSDQTEALYRAHEELKASKEKLLKEEKLSSLRIFTAGMAHEINNPLNFINGAMFLLNDLQESVEKKEAKAKWQQMYNMLQTGYDRILKIVRNLTYFSFDAGYAVEEKDVHKIIGMALIMLRSNIPKTVKIKTNYTLKELVPVHTENLHSVIVNLVNNAIHATVNSSKKLKLIEIKTFKIGKNAHISVYNSGEHIPENIINKIFNPFFTGKKTSEGTGLGLSICYTLINKHHNGDIKVENVKGGVLFTIILPLADKKEESPNEEEESDSGLLFWK